MDGSAKEPKGGVSDPPDTSQDSRRDFTTARDVTTYTRIYPVRSLLSDVQPSSDPEVSGTRDYSLTRSTDSGEPPPLRPTRTAIWQATLAAADLRTPGFRTSSSPLSTGTATILSPTGTGQPFFSAKSLYHPSNSVDSPESQKSPSPDGLAQTSSESNKPLSSAGDLSPPNVPSSSDSNQETVVIQPSIDNGDQPDQDNESISSSTGRHSGSLGSGGYVHLGPAPTNDGYSDASGRYSPRSNDVSRASAQSGRSGVRNSISVTGNVTPADTGNSQGDPGSMLSSASMSRADDSSSESSSTDNFYKTSRFQHVETHHGHYLLLGREGTLERCEDEPIHAPGAVQGFGVLVALEEDYETGNLIVRQVSENCTEILGLSPHYLFNLQCFTHTLPQMQADILWDNIQYLSEPDGDPSGSTDEGPQVFLLSGYGQPGSAFMEHDMSGGESSDQAEGSSTDGAQSRSLMSWPSNSSTERRTWTCWCAAHRPNVTPTKRESMPSSAPDDSNFEAGASEPVPLIILEFELEHDMFNPLYPPQDIPESEPHRRGGGAAGSGSPSVRSEGSGSGSGNPASGGGRSSDGSDRTTMPAAGSPAATTSGNSTTPTGADPYPASHKDKEKTQQTHSDGAPSAPPSAEAATSSSTVSSSGINAAGAPSSTSNTILTTTSSTTTSLEVDTIDENEVWHPSTEQILASTTKKAQPIRALERMRQVERTAMKRALQRAEQQRRIPSSTGVGASGGANHKRRGGIGKGGKSLGYGGSGTLDVFAVLAQVNEQLSAAPDLQSFLDVVVGIMKDLTQFHRVLIYQFDETANGQVVAELVDWSKSHDLYRGLHFPAGDIPAQARALYRINKVRSLYNRDQTTARLVGRTRADVENPLDLTHSYLRAMSPIHLKYLNNMSVRSSMSISIVSFGQLWGLICCHSYGDFGMRVSFPVRQMLRLLSDSISRNIERLSYAHRLHTRKLINTVPTEGHPTGHIVSNAEDLLGLFDADFGVLVIGEGAKILGPNEHGQDILIIAEYLRLKQFKIMQVTQDITKDFPDINLHAGLNVIAGVLVIPLSNGGKDFIAFLRKGQLREITWAGRPNQNSPGGSLEPRASFKAWSETVASRSRSWTDEQLETAGVLSLVYGKFIDVWRQKESAVKATQLTNLLLANASHEVRTPLNHIINYLELALNGQLDTETRDNLSMSHAASKNLLFTINDLLDLTRLESGNETSLNEPFDFTASIEDAIKVYRTEAERRAIKFIVDTKDLPKMVVGDSRKIRTVVANLTANAVKFTQSGSITIEARQFNEPEGLRDASQIVVEIIVADTGCGIEPAKLESIFREFEQVENSTPEQGRNASGLGLGLAVVARIVEQLGGQLRVFSKPGVGSRFSFLIPFTVPSSVVSVRSPSTSSSRALSLSSVSGRGSEIDSLVEAISASSLNEGLSLKSNKEKGKDKFRSRIGSSIMVSTSSNAIAGVSSEVALDPRTSATSAKVKARTRRRRDRPPTQGEVELDDSNFPLRSLKVDPVDMEAQKGASGASSSPILGAPTSSLSPVSPTKSLPERSERPYPPVRSATFEGRSPAEEKTTYPVPDKPVFRILIVEDDVVNRSILQKRLNLNGHTTCTSTNGQEAVDLIEKDRAFDCILMDIQMPILDGFGATKRIREIEKAHPLPLAEIRPTTDLNDGHIPIFVVSASLVESQREFILETGADGWILKPIDFKRMSWLIRGAIDPNRRKLDLYSPGCNWENGGWLRAPTHT